MLAPTFLILGALGGGLVFQAGPFLQGQATAPPAIPKELTSYRDVVKKVLPAVVSIESRSKPAASSRQSPPRRRSPLDDQIPEEFRRFFEDFGRIPFEIPDEVPFRGFGSGFVVDPKGVVLTNFHVVDGADQVEIQFADGRKFLSRDIKTDPKTDLAIVRIDARGPLPYLELGDSDQMEIGDRVLAVGAPFGLTGSVTHGIISGKGRSLRMNMYEDFVQTDAAINPGNSGGPLVNLEGKVIGINSAIKSRSGGFQGVGLAISSNLARNIMTQLLKEGVVHRGYLGVQIKDLTDRELAARLGVERDGGVLVTTVFDDSPAAKAGIQEGDVIIALEGKPIKESRQLQMAVAALPLGRSVEVTVVRDGKPRRLQVTIEEQPAQFGTTRVPLPRTPRRDTNTINLDKIGAEATDLTPELAEQLGYKSSAKGALITRVEEDGLAALGGLSRGMLVTKVDRVPVTSAAELRDALEKKSLEEGVLLQVQSPQGGTSFVLLRKS
ncbi:MAG TPA: Do family serine endopeptidase [Gemmataceae bacterium]|jgi:serine protease Do|nr:Do family serine endopeptidase [Gemmataceae bacterium]